MKMDLGVGGKLAGRSIVKSAVAFAHCSGIPSEKCQRAMAYLLGDDDDPPYGFYYERDLVMDRPGGTPLHCVALAGSAERGLLLGYVELFGIHRQVVCLSEAYDGPDIAKCYAIDPRSATPLDISVQMPFDAADLRDIYDYRRIPDDGYEKAISQVLPPELRRHKLAERDRAISDAYDYAVANCGAKVGDEITPEVAGIIAALFRQRLTPYIANLVARPVLPPNFGKAEV